MERFDLVIVGAGPARSTLARLLGEDADFCREHRVLLIDGQKEQNRKPCGGLLAPDAQKALTHFDLTLPKSVLVDLQIFSVKTIDVERRLVRFYRRHYLNINRYAFDKWLCSLVPETVVTLQGRCTKMERTGEGFLITVRAGGEERQITAKTLVGAEGANSPTRKSFYRDNVFRYVRHPAVVSKQ